MKVVNGGNYRHCIKKYNFLKIFLKLQGLNLEMLKNFPTLIQHITITETVEDIAFNGIQKLLGQALFKVFV